MQLQPMNQSSVSALTTGKVTRKQLKDEIKAIVTAQPSSYKEIVAELKSRGFKLGENDWVHNAISEFTNAGLFRQLPTKDSEGNTIWERTALKTPLPDDRLSQNEIKALVEKMSGALSSIANIGKSNASFKPDYDLLKDYSRNLAEIKRAMEGYQDRTDEPEYKRRVSLGL